MRRITIAILIVWFGASFGLKLWRYGHELPQQQHPEQNVVRFMTTKGWTRTAALDHRDDRLTFTKPDCNQNLTVLLLSPGAETTALIEKEFEHDKTYFEDGEVVSRPNPLKNSINAFQIGLGRVLGAQTQQDHPVLAVYPAVKSDQDACNRPTLEDWKALYSSN